MATLGLDTSAYESGIKSVQSETKKTITELSSEYTKASKCVAELTKRYNESVAKTGKTSSETKNLKKMLAQAEAQLKTTTTALKAADNGMESFGQKAESAGSSLASSMTKAQLFVSAIQKLSSTVISFGKSILETGVSYNQQLETYQTALTNMMGSAEKASAFLQQIQQDAARTPFSTDSLVAANQYLLSAGENAEYSRKTILALGDAIKATGGGDDELNRMAQNLQQVANVGKASAVDIKQFAFAGINIYQVLADYTGKSVQEVQSMTITYDMLTQALQAAAEEGGRYYNSMSTQSQTLSGRLTTLQDNAKQLAAALTENLANAYGTLVSKANELVIAMKDGWETDGFQGMMAAAADAIPQLEGVANALAWIQENADILIPIVTSLAGAFLAFKVAAGAQGVLGAITALLNPTSLITAGLGALAGALVTAYTKCEPFRNAVNGAFSTLSSVAGNAINWTVGKIHTLISAVAGAIAALESLKNGEGWEAAQNAYVNAYNQKQNQYNSRSWDNSHANMEWDENDGWVPKNTAQNDSGNGTSRPEAFTPKGTTSSITSTGGDTTKKNKDTKKTVTERTDWSQQDAATSYSKNAYGQVTTATTELTEHILKSDGTQYTKFTKTITESGKEMVNGVVKNYKTITKYVDKFDEKGNKIGDTVAQTEKVYEDASKNTLSKLISTTTQLLDGVTTTTQKTTEKYADGSEHIKEIVTKTGHEIVDGVDTTYTEVTTLVDGQEEDVTKTYDDMSKTLLGTVTSTATKLVDGISTATEKITQKYADGSEKAIETTTETGRRLVNGVWETYTKIKKISEDGQETTTENTEKEVSQYDTLLSAYNKAKKDVDTLRAAYEASAAASGENSEETQRLSALLTEGEDTLTDAAEAWKEYEKTTDRSYVVTKRFGDYLKKYNSAFSDFGSSISALGEFFDSDAIQGVGDFFTEITDGVDKVINLATSTATLVETLQQLNTQLQTIKAAGGVSTLLSGAGKLLGGTGTAAAATGAGGAGASGLAALGISVPEIGAILLAVLGVGAVGYGIYKLVTKNRNKDTVGSSVMSYKDLQDAYWYGNERAFAGYDYRTDPFTFNPNNNAVLGYQTKMQEQLAKLTEVVQQYLPDVANQQIVLDDGTLVGKMAPGMDTQLGQLAALAERGN